MDTGAVFYVGKGTRRRAWNASPFHRNPHWERIVAKVGGFTVSFADQFLSDKEALSLEIKTISDLRSRGVELCNQTDGGDGTSGWVKTEEWRRKVGDAHRGKSISLGVRKKISESVRACGYVPSEEARKKMSETHMGKKRSLGYRHTEEWKREKSKNLLGNKSRTGQTRSEKERILTSLANRGRPQPKHTCPHCGKVGGNTMLRWHFENCKRRVA
jgi:hypothetical protein